MKVGLAQVNSTVGDLEVNVDRIVAAVDEAAALGAEIVVLPELAVTGCSPRDIFFDETFVAAVEEANRDLAARVAGGPVVVVGSTTRARPATAYHPGLFNAALVLSQGEITNIIGKQGLRFDGVHYEPRWFLPGRTGPVIEVCGRPATVLVGGVQQGNDVGPRCGSEAEGVGALILLCPSASEYVVGVFQERLAGARRAGGPVVYVNACGANDEVLFDGRSFVIGGRGEVLTVLPLAEEAVQVVDLQSAAPVVVGGSTSMSELFTVLSMGIEDFARKNRLGRAFIGLSGGIDSSVVACLATRALGQRNVTGVAIPSRYTDQRSTNAARRLAHELGIEFEVVNLEELHAATEKTLGELVHDEVTAENVQARLRSLILMAMVNKHRGFLVNTSNKTELALGYGTLYGDLAGAICPIGDLNKLEVVSLARWIAETTGEIPAFVLDREPTAELRPDQVDPFDYSEVAPALDDLLMSHRCNAAIRAAEHKRRQAGVVLKVSRVAFGSGRLVPITRR